jgi:hypothetical protein
MVVRAVNYDELHAPRNTIDQLIDTYPPPSDLDVDEARSVHDKHKYAIQAIIANQLGSRGKTWLQLRLQRDIRTPVQQYLSSVVVGRRAPVAVDYQGWAFYPQAKQYILDNAPAEAIYQLLGLRGDDSEDENEDDMASWRTPMAHGRSSVHGAVGAHATAAAAGVAHAEGEDESDDDGAPVDVAALLQATGRKKRKRTTTSTTAGSTDMNEKERGAAKLRKLREKLLSSAAKRAAERAEADSDDESPINTLLDLALLKATTTSAATSAGADDRYLGRAPKVSDIPAALVNSFDYSKGGDTVTFFENLEDFFDIHDVKPKHQGACLLICTTGTIRKQLRTQRQQNPGLQYDAMKEWVEMVTARPDEDSIIYKKFISETQGRSNFRKYVTELTERFEECKKHGVQIPAFQFRQVLCDNMHPSILTKLKEDPAFRSQKLPILIEKAVALEESMRDAGTLRMASAADPRQSPEIQSYIDTEVNRRMHGGKGDGKGKGQRGKGKGGKSKSKGNKGKGKGKAKGSGGRGTAKDLPQHVKCTATVKSFYTAEQWKERTALVKDRGNPHTRPDLHKKDRYKGEFVCWVCRTYGDHTLDRCPRYA